VLRRAHCLALTAQLPRVGGGHQAQSDQNRKGFFGKAIGLLAAPFNPIAAYLRGQGKWSAELQSLPSIDAHVFQPGKKRKHRKSS
jgi:hypothetical protein